MRHLYLAIIALVTLISCDEYRSPPRSSSGVQQTSVRVPTGSDGLTAEQRNIRDRLVEDNKPGSIKHLYIISAYSGQVILYSTVRGKVTSSGKRLTPTTVATNAQADAWNGIPVRIGDLNLRTSEVLQDDGSYGSSVEYLFWWDVRGAYHQHYVSGGQIVHISNQPISVRDIIINLEVASAPSQTR